MNPYSSTPWGRDYRQEFWLSGGAPENEDKYMDPRVLETTLPNHLAEQERLVPLLIPGQYPMELTSNQTGSYDPMIPSTPPNFYDNPQVPPLIREDLVATPSSSGSSFEPHTPGTTNSAETVHTPETPETSYTNDTQETPSRRAAKRIRLSEEDLQLLTELRRQDLPYKEILKFPQFHGINEGTLRGRYRTSTKLPEKRLRTPTWAEIDDILLRKAVMRYFDFPYEDEKNMGNNTKAPWKMTSKYISENGGTYDYSYSTCCKRWMQIRLLPAKGEANQSKH